MLLDIAIELGLNHGWSAVRSGKRIDIIGRLPHIEDTSAREHHLDHDIDIEALNDPQIPPGSSYVRERWKLMPP